MLARIAVRDHRPEDQAARSWLDSCRPSFLDRIDTDPKEAAAGLYVTMVAVLHVPDYWPKQFASLQPEEQKEIISGKFMYLIDDDFKALRRYADQGVPFGGYLKIMLGRAAQDLIDRRQRELGYESSEHENVVPGRVPAPESSIQARRDCMTALQLMRSILSPLEIAAVMLRHYYEYSIEEVTQQLNLGSHQAAYAVINPALRKLRRRSKP